MENGVDGDEKRDRTQRGKRNVPKLRVALTTRLEWTLFFGGDDGVVRDARLSSHKEHVNS